MKVLVLSNCSLQSYVAYLRAAHPAWDVRGVLIPQAKKFVEDKHQGFMEFLGQVDLFLGLTDLDFMDSYFPASTQRLYVPRFSYFGLQPDAFFVAQLPSVLGRGVAHSRLAMQSYLKGLNLSEAEALFNADTFDRMGYFERRDVDREQMTKRFAKFRIDVSELIDYWIKQSLFLYYPSHPKIQFFFDLIDLIMRGSGIPPDISAVRLQEEREKQDDYLEGGVHWPIYTEIAAHHGIKAASPSRWRASAAQGSGEHFDLKEMLRRSWAIYDAADRKNLEKALGSAQVADVAVGG